MALCKCICRYFCVLCGCFKLIAIKDEVTGAVSWVLTEKGGYGNVAERLCVMTGSRVSMLKVPEEVARSTLLDPRRLTRDDEEMKDRHTETGAEKPQSGEPGTVWSS